MIRSMCGYIIILGGTQALYSQAHQENITPKTAFIENAIRYDDFHNEELGKWEIVDEIVNESSNWYIEQGFLIQNSNTGNTKELRGTHIVAGNSEWKNYFLKTEIIGTDDDFIGVLFRYQDKENYYCFVHSSRRKKTFLGKRVSGDFSILDDCKTNDAYLSLSLTFSALRDTLSVYLDNILILSAIDDDLTAGKIGFMSCANTGLYVDYVAVSFNYKTIPFTKGLTFIRDPYLQSVIEIGRAHV